MLRVFLIARQLIITKKNEVEFRDAYGRGGEVLEVIADERSVDYVMTRLENVYKLPILVDGKFKKKWGWPYFSKELQEKTRAASKEYRTGRPWNDEIREKISKGRAGKGNFVGKKHMWESKMMISQAMNGNTNVRGLKWAHDPLTGKEKRLRDGSLLPSGFVWGRTPEVMDWFSRNRLV